MQHLNKWDWRICSTFAAVNKKQEDMTHKQHKIENLTKKKTEQLRYTLRLVMELVILVVFISKWY